MPRVISEHWFWFSSFHVWSRKLARSLKPIRLKFNTNRPMITRVFPRFKRSCLYFEYPLTPRKIFLSLISCCYYHGFRLTILTQKGSKFPKKLNFLPAALVLTWPIKLATISFSYARMIDTSSPPIELQNFFACPQVFLSWNNLMRFDPNISQPSGRAKRYFKIF